MDKLRRLNTKDYKNRIFPDIVNLYEAGKIDFYTFCNWCKPVKTLRELLISYLRNKDVLKITKSERSYLISENLDFESEIQYKLMLVVHSLYSTNSQLETLCMCVYLGRIWAVDYAMWVKGEAYLQNYYKAGGKELWV